MLLQDIVAYLVDSAAGALSEAVLQLLGAAQPPAAVQAVAMQLASCGVHAALAAVLGPPRFATAAPAAETCDAMKQNHAIAEAAAPRQPRRPPLLAAAHAAAVFAGTVELLLDLQTGGTAAVPNSLTTAASKAAAGLLAFSSTFRDEGVLLEPGARFAATGASLLAVLVAVPGAQAVPLAAQQVHTSIHAVSICLLVCRAAMSQTAWLPPCSLWCCCSPNLCTFLVAA